MNSNVKRVVLLLVGACLVFSSVYAGNKSRIGTAGAQELLIPVGARGLALGGSALSSVSGVDAIFWNPAGLAHMTGSGEAMFSQMSYIADIGVTYGALGIKAGSWGDLGFSIKSLSFGDIPVTNEQFPDGTGQTYSPSFIDFGFTYASQLSDRIAFGVTATLVTEKIQSTSASSVAFSGGLQYQGLGLPGLSLGVAIKNVGSGLTFDGSNLLVTAQPQGANREATFYKISTATADLPTSLEIGLAYLVSFNDNAALNVTTQFQNNNYQDDEYKLGGEFSYNKMFFVRGGYTFAPSADKDPTGQTSYQFDYTFGAGVRLDLGGATATVDYAYRHQLILSANNVLAITLGF
jgi:hypothetical protein